MKIIGFKTAQGRDQSLSLKSVLCTACTLTRFPSHLTPSRDGCYQGRIKLTGSSGHPNVQNSGYAKPL